MSSVQPIDDFLNQDSYAVVGVSRTGKKFGNSVYRMLKERGFAVFPVNPQVGSIDGDRCYARVQDLPKRVGGVVIVVPPKQTERVLKDVAEAGIRRVWMQQGSESKRAIQYCDQFGIEAVYGRCIFMFAEPVESIHKVHRWVANLFHRLPT